MPHLYFMVLMKTMVGLTLFQENKRRHHRWDSSPLGLWNLTPVPVRTRECFSCIELYCSPCGCYFHSVSNNVYRATEHGGL
jgi:hypothetical protein